MKQDEDVPLYRGQPLPYSTEPVTLRRAEADRIESALTKILQQVEDFTNQALKDKTLLRTLGVPEDLDPHPTPLGLHIPFARFDFLWDGKDFNILELNTDGTSGYNVMEWVNAKAGLQAGEDPNAGLSGKILQALLEHQPQTPEIVLVDFHDVGTSWEQKDLIRRWQNIHPCRLADPGARSWKPGALVYRRALSWQLRAQVQRAGPFLSDWKEGKITVVGGWSSDVGMSKAWPAFVKPAHCPETHVLDPNFAENIKNEKDLWILKGALSYSGQAVVRGLDLTENRWKISLEHLSGEGSLGRPWIAQRTLKVPKLDGKSVEFGLYFLNGKPSGYMCRWGHDEPISEASAEILRPVQIIS